MSGQQTLSLDDKMPGCECAKPHLVGKGVLVKLLRDLRDADLRPNEEIDAVALFVRSWLDLRSAGWWPHR